MQPHYTYKCTISGQSSLTNGSLVGNLAKGHMNQANSDEEKQRRESELQANNGIMPIEFDAMAYASYLQFNSAAPKWRLVGRGLSMDGICQSKGCPAFGQTIVHNFRFGLFNILKILTADLVECPECLQSAQAKGVCCFLDCKFKISGAYMKNGKKQKMTGTGLAGEDKLTYFGGDDSEQVGWLFLEIESEDPNQK